MQQLELSEYLGCIFLSSVKDERKNTEIINFVHEKKSSIQLVEVGKICLKNEFEVVNTFFRNSLHLWIIKRIIQVYKE